MLKTAISGWTARGGIRRFTKALLFMKLTMLLMTAAFLHVSAKGVSQNVTFSGKNVPLEKIFAIVEHQTGFVFLYTKEILNDAKPVSLNESNVPLEQFLKKLFENQPINFTLSVKSILLSSKAGSVVVMSSAQQQNTSGTDALPPLAPIHGIVRNVEGQLISGANIIIKGTRRGVAAGVDGSFSIDAKVGDTLVITSIGYQPYIYRVKATANEIIIAILKPSTSALDEVAVSVNTGYQRIRPEQITGSVSIITTKEYESQVNTDFLNGLEGKLPGVLVVPTLPGKPATGAIFNIRGISTMYGNASPLIVLDGFPTELTLDMINPNEIKSVTVLKDAAAASIYGVRAANGVLVIERKQAVPGKAAIAFRVTEQVTPKTNYTRYRWAPDASALLVNYQRTTLASSVNAASWSQFVTRNGSFATNPVQVILAQQAAHVISPDQANESFAALSSYNNAAEFDRTYEQNPTTQTFNLDVSGGNRDVLYYITANYNGQKQEAIKNNNNRIQLTGRTTVNMSKRLSVTLTTDYQQQNSNTPPVPSVSGFYSYEHLKDVNGNPVASAMHQVTNPYYNNVLMSTGLQDDLYYPLVELNETKDTKRTINDRLMLQFQYKIASGLNFSLDGIYENSGVNLRHYAPETTFEARQYVDGYATMDPALGLIYNMPQGGYLHTETDNTTTYTVRSQLAYNKKIHGDHSINVILGAEVRDLLYTTISGSSFGYNDQTLLQQPVDYASMIGGSLAGNLISPYTPLVNVTDITNQQYADYRFVSGYSNLVYSFRNTYILSAGARIDQSDLFGSNPKYKYRPAWTFGAAWNINKERFMENITWIKDLKLRAAGGITGNVAALSLPETIAQSTLNYLIRPSTPALTLVSYANSGLRWERTYNWNIGLDYRLIKGITGSVDYYRKKSIDLVTSSQIDPTLGASPSFVNSGDILNTGLEIGLHADLITTKKVNWNMGLVVSRNTSLVLSVYDPTPNAPTSPGIYRKGYPANSIFSYNDAGLDNQGYPQMANTKGRIYHTENALVNGLYPWEVTDAMNSDTAGISHYSGTTFPSRNIGLTNRVDIGKFYFYLMLNYIGGFKVRVPRPDPTNPRPLTGSGNYWKQPGDEKNTDIMSLAAFAGSVNAVEAYTLSDKYVVNGDCITINNLMLSYSLDNQLTKHMGFTHFEVRAQASNLWTVGLNRYNYSYATYDYAKPYATPSYTIAIYTNF